MTISRRTLIAALAAAGTASMANAQTPGDKAVRLVVPIPPGSGADAVTRIVAAQLREQLKQPVVIDNKPGADMMIGAAHVAKAQPDGTTLLMGHFSTMVLNPLVYNKLGYDPVKDFVPIGRISHSTALIAVHPSVPATTLGEFVAHVKANPGRVSYGTAILMTQLAAEQLTYARRLQMVRIPYKGGAQAMQDTVSGQIDMSMADPSAYSALIKAGKLRALATTGHQRNPLLPDVPTVREAGFPEMEIQGWWGVFAPAQTPKSAVAKLSTALGRAVASTEVVSQLRNLGYEAAPLGSEQFRQLMKQDADHWSGVIKALKFKPGE